VVVLVVLSVTSLVSGTEAGFIRRGLHTVVTVTSRPFLKALRGIERRADYVVGLVGAYDTAYEEARILRRRVVEQMQFTAQRHELAAENQRLRRMLRFARQEPRLVLAPAEAEVIAIFEGILKTDRGSMHGIEESMGVLTEAGAVGLVSAVDWTTSTVITLHNPRCRIGAMIRRNRVRGVVRGSSSDLSRTCTMEYIDTKDEVREGDEVVTSPESLFPSGYPVGRVVAIDETGTLWKVAYIEPAVNPYQLDEVFIVRRAVPSSDELTGLDGLGRDAPNAAPALPDDRPVQQRYAP